VLLIPPSALYAVLIGFRRKLRSNPMARTVRLGGPLRVG